MNVNFKKIEIEDYISNSLEAKQIVSDFGTNKFIEKQSCGLGGTSTILGITNQTIIICSPLVGMIQSKEKEKEEHQIFLYGAQNHINGAFEFDKWKTVSNRLSNNEHFILNTTPNQLIKLKKSDPYLYGQIKKIPIFVDECHMAAESDYRSELWEFMHLLFTEWTANYTLSTATPSYNYMDIPEHIACNMKFYLISRMDEPIKQISILPHDLYTSKVLEEVSKGNKVVLFTNSLKAIKNLISLDGISTQILVGEKLDTKLRTTKEFTEAEIYNMSNGILDENIEVSILSTKYLTGFDIPFTASVIILSHYDSVSPVENRTINDIVQAYGRMRGEVKSAVIFYHNDNFNKKTDIKFYENEFEQALKTAIKIHGKPEPVNHTEILKDYLPSIEEHRTFKDIHSLVEGLTLKGFQVDDSQYLRTTITIINPQLSLSEKLRNLLTLNVEVLRYHVEIVFKNINGDAKSYSGFNKQYLTLFAAAYIIKLSENNWLTESADSSTQVERLILVMKTFIDVNVTDKTKNRYDANIKFKAPKKGITIARNRGGESSEFYNFNHYNPIFQNAIKVINTLYVIDKVQKDDLEKYDLQQMDLKSLISKQVQDDFVNFLGKTLKKEAQEIKNMITNNDCGLNRLVPTLKLNPVFSNTLNKVEKKLSFIPNEEQLKQIRIKIENLKTILIKYDPIKETGYNVKFRFSLIDHNRKSLIKRHRYFLLGLLSLDIAGHTGGFKKTIKDNREYNFATKCPSFLRHYTAYRMTEIDIISAYPQFIDKQLGTTNAFTIYENLMSSYDISRSEAKIKFNSTINNHKLEPKRAIEIYLKAGYNKESATELSKLTTEGKSYYNMTKKESQFIYQYNEEAHLVNAVRIHDGLIIFNYNNEIDNLPTEVGSIKFKISEK